MASTRRLELDALAHANALYNLARRLDASAADDLVQETYARAFASIAHFTAGTNLKAWLFRILRNCHIDRIRRSRHEPELHDDVDVADDSTKLDDAALDRIRHRAVDDIEAALRALPDEQRLVVLLDLEDLTETEIADVVGCAVGTVKSRLSRARASLRVTLAHWKPS